MALNTLTLANTNISGSGSTAVNGLTPGSTVTITNNPENAFSFDGANLVYNLSASYPRMLHPVLLERVGWDKNETTLAVNVSGSYAPGPILNAGVDVVARAAAADAAANSTAGLANKLGFDTSTQNLNQQQKTNASINLGLPFINANTYPGIDPTGLTDCTTAWSALINYANGRKILGYGAVCKVQDWFIGDTPVNIEGVTFIQAQGKRVFLHRPTMSAPQAVSAVSTVLIGPATSTSLTQLNMTKIACANAYLFPRGTRTALASQDVYPLCTQYKVEQGYNTYSCYLRDLIEVSAIGQDYTGLANGGFSQGDIVTGATSGSVGVVRAVGNNGAATDTILLATLTGAFSNGENLLVGGVVKGVASGACYILTSEQLVYAARYTTNITIRALGSGSLRMTNCAVQADGDIDGVFGSSSRQYAFVFEGSVEPVITNFRCRSAWQRCFQWVGCWAPRVTGMQVDKLPNNANPSESAFGYGNDACGATAYGLFENLTGGHGRHAAYTTNGFGDVNGDNYAARAPFTYDGLAKRNTVRNSRIMFNTAEPFDTHPGDWYTTFENCISESSDGVGMNVTAPGGFKTRGFSTRFINCISVGGLVGFNDYSALYDAGATYIQHFINCEARRYTKNGFLISQPPFDTRQRHTIFEGCWAKEFASEASNPYPAGFAASNGSRIVVKGGGAAGFAGTPISMGTGQYWSIENFHIDWVQASTTNSATIRFDGVPQSVMIVGLTHNRHPTNPSLPLSAIRNATSSTFYFHLEGVKYTGGIVTAMAEIPLVQNTNGGSATPFYRRDGRYVVVSNTIPTGASPVGGNWPLGSFVEFPQPQSGNNRAVCTTSGNPGTWTSYP